ncbi:MAG: hypothetical protein ACRCWJ_16965 [Casimicrobium sp.]
MKHASENTLLALTPLLDELRKRPMREKKLGIFYVKSKSFLHFHEDPAGLFADLRFGEDFERFPVNTKAEQAVFLKAVDRAL